MKWVIVPNTFFHRDAMSVTTMFKLVLGVESLCCCGGALMSVMNKPSGMVKKRLLPQSVASQHSLCQRCEMGVLELMIDTGPPRHVDQE